MQKRQCKHVRGQICVTNSQAVADESWLMRCPLSPWFSQNNPLVVTGCHFWPRTIFRPPLLFVHPCLLIFRVSVGPPFIKTLPPHYFELESISSAQILLIVQATAIHHSIFYFSSFSMFLLVHFSVRRTSSIFKMNDVTTFQSLHHLLSQLKIFVMK